MFRREGPSPDPRKSAILAGYLAFVAGFVNSGGFVLIQSFTSHVTGSVGRLANDITLGDAPAALSAAVLVLTFFLGAFYRRQRREPNSVGLRHSATRRSTPLGAVRGSRWRIDGRASASA
jgi:uncharacterized membrane protein YoaK (UPF0700 family)